MESTFDHFDENQTVEENAEMIEQLEAKSDMEELLADEEEFDPDKAIDDMNLPNLTLVELNLRKREMNSLYESSNDMFKSVQEMMTMMDNHLKSLEESDSEFHRDVKEANEPDAGTKTTMEAYQQFMDYTSRQLEGYKKVIDAIEKQISTRELEVNTTKKAHADVSLASERMLNQLGEINQGNIRNARILEKMKEACSEEYLDDFLKDRASKNWTYLPYAKEAVLRIYKKKEDPGILIREISKELNDNIKVSDYVKSKNVVVSEVILSMMLKEMTTIVDTDTTVKHDDISSRAIGTILLYTVVKDWMKVLTSTKKGNGAYVRVYMTNLLDIALNVYDGDIESKIVLESLHSLINAYYVNIADVIPKAYRN